MGSDGGGTCIRAGRLGVAAGARDFSEVVVKRVNVAEEVRAILREAYRLHPGSGECVADADTLREVLEGLRAQLAADGRRGRRLLSEVERGRP
jgi:hypothetical protein